MASTVGNPYESPPAVAEPPKHELAPSPGGWKVAVAAGAISALLLCVPLLNFPPIVFLGWAASRAWPRWAAVGARATSVCIAMLLLTLFFSGLPLFEGRLAGVHKWAGHLTVTLVYMSAAFSLGVVFHQSTRRSIVIAVTQSLAIVFCLLMTLSASFTGYLDIEPSQDSVIAEANHNRFVVLHIVLQPTILATLLVIWFFCFRVQRRVPIEP